MKTVFLPLAMLIFILLAALCACNTETGASNPDDSDSGVDLILITKDENGNITIDSPCAMIHYDITTGLAALYLSGETVPVLQDIYTETKINNTIIRSYEMTRDINCMSEAIINDGFGRGKKITVTQYNAAVTVLQHFYVYQKQPFFLAETVVQSSGGETLNSAVSTNYIAVLKAGLPGNAANILNQPAADRFLSVPFDNDEWVRYNARPLYAADSESYEAAAVYENASRKGFVTGSVSHDTWKTGIRLYRTADAVTGFSVFSGITSYQTRDTINRPASAADREHIGAIIDVDGVRPHGSVSGGEISSAKVFFGFFDDWRDGMEEYGRANGVIAAPLYWAHGVPFGWNSWAAVGDKVNYTTYIAASDFLKTHFSDFNNGSDAVYANLDSFWDNLSESQRKQAAGYVTNSGQNPGIYHTPFTVWHERETDLRAYSPDGVSMYKWWDLVLKDANGYPIKFMSGKGWPLDPTHPGTVQYNDYRMRQFRDWGFRYVKLDFMSHGALEGNFYDETKAVTGIQAYNYGMQKLLESMGPDLAAGDFFVSLSIAPVFPSQYAHSRRLSCDVFGTMANAEYLLNSVSYGWWLHNSVYPFNDPDHIVLYQSYNAALPVLREEVSTAHYIAAAITGGLMLSGDNITAERARERVKKILNNPEVNALAADSRTFRPVEGDTDYSANTFFVRDDRGINGDFYLAVFNFGSAADIVVDFPRIGLDSARRYDVYDLITHNDLPSAGGNSWTIYNMPYQSAKLFRLRARAAAPGVAIGAVQLLDGFGYGVSLEEPH